MTQSTQPLPTLGQPNSTEDSKVRSLLSEIQGIVNGNVDASNLANNAVTTTKITDANVTKAKLATDSLQAFLQLASASTKKLAFGFANASTNVSTNLVGGTVAHGLGAAPVFAFAIIAPGGGVGAINAVCTGINSIDATNVVFYFQGINGAAITGGNVNFYWIAVA